MTTQAAAEAYLANHLAQWHGKGYAVFNPHNKPIEDLPVVYGFNNTIGGGSWQSGVLLAEDGKYLGGHICSHEGYMPHDLGIVEGSRPDRHEDFQKHYPDGYRMDFVSAEDVADHPGVTQAYKRHQTLTAKSEAS